MNPRIPAIAVLAALAACSTVPVAQHVAPPVPAPAQAARQVHPVWESPAADFPAICMIFQADGSLLFRGGFAFFNPSRWQRDGITGEVIVTLGGSAEFPTEVMKQEAARKVGALAGFNEHERKVIYKLDAATEFIDFGNFYFYPVESCHASQ